MFVIGDASKEYGTGIWISGAEATATNTGTIYVQGKVAEGAAAKSWRLHGMGAANGATAVNQGTIEADNAYGMYVGTGSGSSTIINDTTGVIRVTTQGAGMELGAASGNKAINRGTITVEAPAADKINDYQFTHGVLIQESSGNEFTNYGTIDATNGSSAIEVKKNASDTANNTINLEAGSRVLGLVHVDAAATNTTLNLKGMQGSLRLKVEEGSQNSGDHFTLYVKDGVDVTLEDGQKSTIDVANITNGTLTASIFQADNAFTTVNLEEQASSTSRSSIPRRRLMRPTTTACSSPTVPRTTSTAAASPSRARPIRGTSASGRIPRRVRTRARARSTSVPGATRSPT